MIELINKGMYLVDGRPVESADVPAEEARKQTIAYRILQAHNHSGDPAKLKIKFDALISHDITYVGIIQQARASGMKKFPMPYALTNCHNSLCAVGGTINEDDHVFGLSAAKKYGGIYVPANMSVIHSYAREQMAKCGSMILGSDSHTRYGALGTMAVGEGGPELAKQLLNNTWDNNMPEVVMVYMTGKPKKGIGPHDVAIALVGATFESGFVNNRVLEFVGPGIRNLPMDFRNGVDVMTTETTCLSSIWETDETTKGWYETYQRPEDYSELKPGRVAHVIGCEAEAVKLALRWGEDPENAAEAGILHDITKKLVLSDQLILCRKYGIINDNAEEQNFKLLHAKTGAAVARERFGISDEVYNAIRWHTTGKPDMTLLEKIIYMADYIEPNRDFPGVEELRRLAYEDLDKAMALGLEMSLKDIRSSGQEPYKDTVEAFEWYSQLMNKQ